MATADHRIDDAPDSRPRKEYEYEMEKMKKNSDVLPIDEDELNEMIRRLKLGT
jgi:hypothetical protein